MTLQHTILVRRMTHGFSANTWIAVVAMFGLLAPPLAADDYVWTGVSPGGASAGNATISATRPGRRSLLIRMSSPFFQDAASVIHVDL